MLQLQLFCFSNKGGGSLDPTVRRQHCYEWALCQTSSTTSRHVQTTPKFFFTKFAFSGLHLFPVGGPQILRASSKRLGRRCHTKFTNFSIMSYATMNSVCLWIQQKQMYSRVCFVIKHVHPMMHRAPCASSENTTMAATVQYIAADTTNYWNGAMRNKLLHFHRTVSIVNSIQFDHLFPRVGNTNIVFAVFSHLPHLALTMWHPRNLAS